jgi:hypothetical protein
MALAAGEYIEGAGALMVSWRRLTVCRVADWQSAGRGKIGQFADCQSAKQQVANLRYVVGTGCARSLGHLL